MADPRRRQSKRRWASIALLYSFILASAQDISSLPTAAQEQIRKQLQERKQRRKQHAANSNVWGNTVKELAARWGDNQGTIQKHRDFKAVLKVHEIDNYMTRIVNDKFYEPVLDLCTLRYEHCAEMASKGLCTDPSAVGFMHQKCAPACFTCHLLSYETRCPFDEDTIGPAAIEAGELHQVFEIMTQNTWLQERYGPMTIYSMPGGAESGGSNDEPIIAGPWIVSFENFLTVAECKTLIDYGKALGRGFGESKVREHQIDPTFNASELRTSTTNWCRDECYEDAHVERVHQRIEALLSNVFPRDNFEYLQLLRYDTEQFYNTHSDFIPIHLKRPAGPRVLTVFLYLNNVDAGGGTNFPDIGGSGITIQPKMGKVVIWPSVLDANPLEIDERTNHGALPVEKGKKYGANVWVHLRGFKTAEKNCKYEDSHLSR